MAGTAAGACRELETIKEARDVLSSVIEKRKQMEKEAEVARTELADLRKTVEVESNKFKEAAKALAEERDSAKAKLKEYRHEVKRLRDELKAKKPEEQVIVEFRDSDAYDDDLAAVASKKIHRCWVVAEKMCKADPGTATWDNFITTYLEPEEALVRGEGKPSPYVALNSSPPPEV